jgi:hypothetical protein
MTIVPLGKIAVPTPGTPVQVSTDPTIFVNRLVFSQVAGQVGNVYIGQANMVKATYVKVIRMFMQPSTGGFLDTHEIDCDSNGNLIRPYDFWVDANTATEGVIAYGEQK